LAGSLIRKNPGIVLIPVILLLHIDLIRAQEALSDSVVRQRLLFMRQSMERGQPAAGRWWTGWLIGYSAATAGQGAACLLSRHKNTKQDMALGAASTCLGAVGQILSPVISAPALERLAGIPEDTPAARMKKLPEAEKLFREWASREKTGKSWKTHAITGLVNAGCGLVVWLGFKRSVWEGAGNFVLNTVITEAQIWTQPSQVMDDYEAYVKTCQSDGGPERSKSITVWSLYTVPGGIGIQIQF
jgi:hypothetical protein